MNHSLEHGYKIIQEEPRNWEQNLRQIVQRFAKFESHVHWIICDE